MVIYSHYYIQKPVFKRRLSTWTFHTVNIHIHSFITQYIRYKMTAKGLEELL